MPLDARSLGLEGRLQDRRRGRGGGLCLQVGARAGSPLCSSRSGLDSPFPWPSRLPSCPLPPAHLPTPRPLPALAFLPFQPQSPFPCGSPRLELGPSGHPHLQTGANWGEGAGEREGAVGGKGSPITAPTLRTPVRGCGCHFQAGGGGPSRAHAWETSGGGARAPAQRGQRGPVCVCVCVRARALGGRVGSVGSSAAAAHQRQLELTKGALLKNPNQTLRWSPASAGAGAGDHRARPAPCPRPRSLRRPRCARANLQGARNPRFWDYLPSQVPSLHRLPGRCRRPAASPLPPRTDAIRESDFRSGLESPGSPPRPATMTSASLGRAGIPAGAPSPHRPPSSGPGAI